MHHKPNMITYSELPAYMYECSHMFMIVNIAMLENFQMLKSAI